MAVFALTGVTAMVLNSSPDPVVIIDPIDVDPTLTVAMPADGPTWFGSVRQYCNPVEVETRLQWQPAPETDEGRMYEAACYALAGRIDDARSAIERLPEGTRYRGAGVVFEAGHPAADAGDDVAAGPLMELVVEFWPNHYMALYHAGAARFERGDHAVAEGYLERFLQEYSVEDGWRSSALSMLDRIR
jgi:tetratricopeptide (TPR) repeat protein